MNFTAELFPVSWLILSALLSLVILLFCAGRLPWRTLDGHLLNAGMGATVAVLGLWLLQGGLKPGLSFHLLGAAILTLMLGPALALWALALVLLAMAALGLGAWQAFGMNFLCMALLPVGLVWAVLRISQRSLPAHFFIYLFVCAFIAGGASLLLAAVAGCMALFVAGAYSLDLLLDEALPFYFLLSWSEAFTSGLVMAVLLVYRPQWVSTFDDARYLAERDD
ncbi:energy-coupling factor ABC transporter permease [Craterilacuibacter sp.]|uniref:energy-coupling factor ABC transporter permease n=1 Tax=Craterilacuibacter sp. TaxID=2870909 RepID=UPI003F3A5DB6